MNVHENSVFHRSIKTDIKILIWYNAVTHWYKIEQTFGTNFV